jgi:uncharacterized OsmC-like protein
MATPILTYSAESRVVREGVSLATAKQTSFEFDSAPEPDPALAGPAELLCVSLAACVLKNVARFAVILPFAYTGASITVVAEREGEPPRISTLRYELSLETSETPHRIDLLQKNIEKYGTIYNTLARSCEITGVVRAR